MDAVDARRPTDSVDCLMIQFSSYTAAVFALADAISVIQFSHPICGNQSSSIIVNQVVPGCSVEAVDKKETAMCEFGVSFFNDL